MCRAATTTDAIGYAKSLYQKYLSDDAELAVDVPREMKRALAARLESLSISLNMFDEAQALVYQQLQNDVFPRFFYSAVGQKYLNELGPAPATSKQIGAYPQFYFLLSRCAHRDAGADHVRKDVDEGKPRVPSAETELTTIHDISVVNFEKRHDPEKYYAYELRVMRLAPNSTQPVEDPIPVFRRYKCAARSLAALTPNTRASLFTGSFSSCIRRSR